MNILFAINNNVVMVIIVLFGRITFVACTFRLAIVNITAAAIKCCTRDSEV